MRKKIVLFCLVLLGGLVLVAACSNKELRPEYQHAPSLSAYQQSSFSAYLKETRAWLSQHRYFLTDDRSLELNRNSPFSLEPEGESRKGVLLVHGLGDSPYSFVDIAQSLRSNGYRVRTLLLPGHGSKPGDLQLANVVDWQALVHHHTQLFSQELDELWLGGFSTGANLVTIEALENHNIAGLLLFSPAFKPKSGWVQLAPAAAWVVDWADKELEGNSVRYDSLAMQGAASYYQSSENVRAALSQHAFRQPVFIALSEADSVVDTEAVIELFSQRFKHPSSRLLWYGERSLNLQRSQEFSMHLPEYRISTASHMSPLYAPDNAYYGQQGTQRICENGFSRTDKERCLAGEPTWYSGWGYSASDKLHARLTWNPYYQESERLMLQVMNAAPHVEQALPAE